MPNWCTNSMTVKGPKADQDSFHQAMKHEGEFRLLEAFIPRSAYYKTQTGYNDGGYEWCINTWGTKWPEGELEVHYDPSDEKDIIGMSFDTAWAPPLDGIAKIARLYPTLEFSIEWSEPGMAFCGAAVYRDGESVLVEDEFSFEGIDENDWMAQQERIDEIREECATKAYSLIKETVS